MTDAELQAIRDRYASFDSDRKRIANGLDVAVSDVDALLAHVDALQSQLDAVPLFDINDVCFRLDTFFHLYHGGVISQTLTRTMKWLTENALRMEDSPRQPTTAFSESPRR